MTSQIKRIYIVGSLMLLFAVVIGAFGAHAFHEILVHNDRVETFGLANDYHFFHSLGLLCVAIIHQLNPSFQYVKIISLSMFFGMLVFSGSLYLLALINVTWLGAITPVGGLLLISSWSLLLIGFFRIK